MQSKAFALLAAIAATPAAAQAPALCQSFDNVARIARNGAHSGVSLDYAIQLMRESLHRDTNDYEVELILNARWTAVIVAAHSPQVTDEQLWYFARAACDRALFDLGQVREARS
jgi:hypothetical protein